LGCTKGREKFRMYLYQFCIIWVVLGTSASIALHFHQHFVFNFSQMSLSFFLWLNLLICLWEICLFFRIDLINLKWKKYQKQFSGKESGGIVSQLAFTEINLRNFLSMTLWAEIWASYSVFDPSYANRESFGFFIDVGNGFSTLLPTVLFILNMTFPFLSGRWLGILGLISFYQELYGTIIYWLSYLVNRRWKNFTFTQVFLFVACTNSLWFIFPIYGIFISLNLILHDNLEIFLVGDWK